MQRLIGITAISAILILTIGILPPPQSADEPDIVITSNSIKEYPQDYSNDTIETIEQNILDETLLDPIAYTLPEPENNFIENLQEIELSIVETDRVFTESDQSIIEQFLDEQELPSATEKFGIEVQTVLFDSFQNQFPSSSVLSIPSLELTDSEGRLLDLGSIQTSFLGITTDSNRGEESQFNLEGTVEFYLDDDLITTKKLYGSEQGSTNTHELFIVDSIPPPFSNRPLAFTFTLSDEGKDWVNNSDHVYRIVITEISAVLQSDENTKRFSWNGQKIAYELNVRLDDSKKVILNQSNNAISIFKSDSTIKMCGTSEHFKFKYGMGGTTVSNNPSVTVRNSDNVILAQIGSNLTINESISDNLQKTGKHNYGSIVTSYCSETMSGIPRDSDIVIELKRDGETKSYEVHTPKSQINYHIDQKTTKEAKYVCARDDPNSNGCATPTTVWSDIFEQFSSNFGYSSGSTIWDSAVVRNP